MSLKGHLMICFTDLLPVLHTDVNISKIVMHVYTHQSLHITSLDIFKEPDAF